MESSEHFVFTDSARGCGTVLGLVSIVVNGGMAVAGGLLVLRGQLAGTLLALLGAAGFFFGLVLAFARYSGHIDRARRVLVKSWRIGVTLRRRETSLAGFDHVLVRSHLGRSRYAWHRFNSVALAGPAGETLLRRLDGDREAEVFARELAEFLAMPWRDERRSFDELFAVRPRLSGRRRVIIAATTLVGTLVLLGAVGAAVILQQQKPTPPRPARKKR